MANAKKLKYHIMTDDIVEVKAGESIPTDGIIVQGQTSIDES